VVGKVVLMGPLMWSSGILHFSEFDEDTFVVTSTDKLEGEFGLPSRGIESGKSSL